ncbi:MAG: hypothetical protein ABFD90_10810 [Phycisphaerales bacterium]
MRQLYPWFLAVTLVAVVAVMSYLSHEFHNSYQDHARDGLLALTRVAALQIAQSLANNPAEVDARCKGFGQAGGDRLWFAVVSSTGRVFGDSLENPSLVDDHWDRSEIQAAFHTGYGESIHLSPTLGGEMWLRA